MIDPPISYQDAVDYLLSFADFERSSAARRQAEEFALSRITSFLDRLGRPQDGRVTVHVAGSKGKGSTAAMVESIVRASGRRTGLFTSPHLHEFSERIRIDGIPIADEQFAALVAALKPFIAAELEANPGRLSTFELLTAMGFMAFRDAGVEVQVIEVGLGGRLDCTNVFREKAVATVTALSYEHVDVLGHSLAKIAWEKAGIITAGTQAAVLGPQRSADAAAAVREYAADVPVSLIDVEQRYRWESAGTEPIGGRLGQWFRAATIDPRGEADAGALYLTPLLGQHQIENAVTAIATVDALRAQGLEIEPRAVHTGLATVDWPGRLELLGREPWLVVDGAHNDESLERVLEALPVYFPHERLVIVLGALSDKNLAPIAARIQELADTVIVTRPDHPRALAVETVAEAFAGWDGDLRQEANVEAAIAAAEAIAGPADLICALGSLFIAAEARAQIQRQTGPEPTSARADS